MIRPVMPEEKSIYDLMQQKLEEHAQDDIGNLVQKLGRKQAYLRHSSSEERIKVTRLRTIWSHELRSSEAYLKRLNIEPERYLSDEPEPYELAEQRIEATALDMADHMKQLPEEKIRKLIPHY